MLSIPQQYPSIKFIRPISWPEIFAIWKEGEAHQQSWKKHWEERGFDSWEQWRKAYASPLEPEKLEWNLYKIGDPIEVFPEIYGVPSKSWVKKAYQGETTKKLKNIIDIPSVKDHPKVIDLKKNFPAKTMFTGIVSGGKIILIEGMHRACALANWPDSTPPKSDVSIALAEWKKEIPIIGGNYKNKNNG
ncbi:MAG TPA: hypothetical protein VK255_01910 [Patescibacteria group bacterium]|nr:hypothetical protein [Patescibacteria group bacterium]